MAYVMLTTEHCSSSPWSVANYNSMTYERLTEAYRSAAQRSSEAAWVGPGPRVTRAAADPCIVRTTVAWLLRYPDPPQGSDPARWMDEAIRPVRERLLRTLETAQVVDGQWLRTEAVPYNPALHGPLSFWQSGQAGNTRTRNGVDAGGREENRVGPDEAEQFQRRSTIQDRFKETLPWIIGAGVVVGGAAILYLGTRFAQSSSMMPQMPPPPPPPRPTPPIPPQAYMLQPPPPRNDRELMLPEPVAVRPRRGAQRATRMRPAMASRTRRR